MAQSTFNKDIQQKRIGKGTFALVLVVAGVLFSSNLFGFCLGDYLFQRVGIPAWTDQYNPHGAKGLHLTPYYFIPFYLLAFYMGKKFNTDSGAKLGKILAFIMVALMIFFTLFIRVVRPFM